MLCYHGGDMMLQFMEINMSDMDPLRNNTGLAPGQRRPRYQGSILFRLIRPFLDIDRDVRMVMNKVTASMVAIYFFMVVGIILFLSITRNPEVFVLNEETQQVLAQFYNVLIWMLVPCTLGMMGAAARVLLAGMIVSESRKLIFSSGLIAAFSWLGIKSKVFLALVAPYVVGATQTKSADIVVVGSIGAEFYSMALVAVLVGMFASNIYIFINQRVEKLTRDAQDAGSKP